MAQEIFGLVSSDVDRLRRLLASYESGELGPTAGHKQDPRWLETPADDIAGFLDGAASALADLNDAPTVATLSVYSFTTTGSVDTGADETVYHFATVAATTDRWTFARRDTRTGKYKIYYQACSTT